MATKDNNATAKINKRLSYFTNAIKRKELRLWAPNENEIDITTPFGEVVTYLDAVDGVQRINKEKYNNDFDNFYKQEIGARYDNTIKQGSYFCASKNNGGVNDEYIVSVANDENSATLLSVDTNPEDDSITTVYALVTFHLSNIKKAIKIDTLCANQVLPPSGEGTRLMKILEKAGYVVGYHKILLNPVDTAIPFYVDNKFRFLNSKDSRETPDSDHASGDFEEQMQKNVRAQRYWAKLRTAVKLATIMRATKNATKRMELQSRYTNLIKEKDDAREIRINPATMKSYGTPIIPGESLKSNYKFVPKEKRGIPSKLIVPGQSFTVSNKKAELLRSASKTAAKQAIAQREEANAILERVKREHEILRSKASRKSKKGKGTNKTKKRV